LLGQLVGKFWEKQMAASAKGTGASYSEEISASQIWQVIGASSVRIDV